VTLEELKRWVRKNLPTVAYYDLGLNDMIAVLDTLPALIDMIEIVQYYKEVKTIKKWQLTEGWRDATLQDAERDLFAALDALNSKEPAQ
jgi:DUF438 domain-containing protein